MPEGLTGNFAGLEQIIGALEGMSDLVDSICIESSAGIERAIDSCFTLGTDPYGQTWAPLAKSTMAKGRTPPPLTDTGKMRGSVVVYAMMQTIHAWVADPAGYHQRGTKYMPARAVLPDERGLPPAWEAEIRESAMAVIERSWDK